MDNETSNLVWQVLGGLGAAGAALAVAWKKLVRGWATDEVSIRSAQSEMGIIKTLNESIDRLGLMVDHLGQRNKELHMEISKLQNEIASMRNENADLKYEIKNLRTQISLLGPEAT